MEAVDVGVDVHDEHRAAVAGKDVQVIDVKLARLGCQRRVEVMGRGGIPFFGWGRAKRAGVAICRRWTLPFLCVSTTE
jgi:hypothetical protein